MIKVLVSGEGKTDRGELNYPSNDPANFKNRSNNGKPCKNRQYVGLVFLKRTVRINVNVF